MSINHFFFSLLLILCPTELYMRSHLTFCCLTCLPNSQFSLCCAVVTRSGALWMKDEQWLAEAAARGAAEEMTGRNKQQQQQQWWCPPTSTTTAAATATATAHQHEAVFAEEGEDDGGDTPWGKRSPSAALQHCHWYGREGGPLQSRPTRGRRLLLLLLDTDTATAVAVSCGDDDDDDEDDDMPTAATIQRGQWICFFFIILFCLWSVWWF